MNARTHGLCGKDILVGPEQKPEFDQMINGYYLDLDPQGELEQILFDEVTGEAWQLRRVRRMETELSTGPDSYTACSTTSLFKRSSTAWAAITPASSALSTAASKN